MKFIVKLSSGKEIELTADELRELMFINPYPYVPYPYTQPVPYVSPRWVYPASPYYYTAD